jgi:hypothetical protein
MRAQQSPALGHCHYRGHAHRVPRLPERAVAHDSELEVRDDDHCTQAAALLATVQLNCTAPQIQVVDELRGPAPFRTIEDQNMIWMRPAAESGSAYRIGARADPRCTSSEKRVCTIRAARPAGRDDGAGLTDKLLES